MTAFRNRYSATFQKIFLLVYLTNYQENNRENSFWWSQLKYYVECHNEYENWKKECLNDERVG